MAGAIDKKINEERASIEDSPVNFIDARAGILDDVALSREFAQTRLNGLCKEFTGGKNTSGADESFTLAEVCEHLARQRAICYGARALVDNVRKFVFPDFETVNGALQLTEPTTSTFGIKTTDILEVNSIALQNTAGTQTINGNTFSVQLTDYYLVRSRVDGELVDISKNTNPYSTPNADIPFGNAVAYGSSVAGEEAANTWNYHSARANLASIVTNNPGAWNELTVVTLADTLAQGSNTDYTPVGPSFGQKYYLKRHEDYINTFSITGTTTSEGIEITGISDTDIVKIKFGDVISGTGIPEGANGAPTIAAVQSAGNKIRIGNITYTTGTVGQAANVVTLSGGTWPEIIQGKTITIASGGGNVVSRDSDTQITLDNSATVSTGTGYSLSYQGLATANGTITITVNSVPFGFAAHDIFCQAEVVAEGLVKNDDWKPIGDGVGGYGGTNEGPDDQLVANTTQFIGLLGFFDPASAYGADANDLTLSARGDIASEGKEYSGTLYPNIERNPMKPAVGGTNKPYETDTGEIIGTQPKTTGMTDMDLHTGRYVRFDHKRADEVGALPEHRYVTDTAEKWYYELQATGQYVCGSETVAGFAMPNEKEPPGEIDKTGLAECITRIQSTPVAIPTIGSVVGASVPVGATATVPADGDTTTPTLSGTVDSNGDAPLDADDTIGTYYDLQNNYITQHRYHIETVTITNVASPGTDTWAATTATDSVIYPCRYNYVQKHLFEAGGTSSADGTSMSSSNADVAHVQSTVDSLQIEKAFRDPIITGAHAGGSGITDEVFDTYITSEPEGDLQACAESLYDFRYDFGQQGRTGAGNSNANKGTNIDYANTTWAALHTELSTFGTNCTKRVAEVDARIGVPTRAGTRGMVRGTPPGLYVDTVPSSNTTNGFVPYGRTIYNECNYILGGDLNLLGNLIKDIQSLGDLIDIVKKARNRYELYNGRDKEYTDV